MPPEAAVITFVTCEVAKQGYHEDVVESASRMFRAAKIAASSLLGPSLLTFALGAAAQSSYQVVSLTQAGTITGTVKWSGPLPHAAMFPIDKDPQVCDPDSQKTRDLERLIVGPQTAWQTPSYS